MAQSPGLQSEGEIFNPKSTKLFAFAPRLCAVSHSIFTVDWYLLSLLRRLRPEPKGQPRRQTCSLMRAFRLRCASAPTEQKLVTSLGEGAPHDILLLLSQHRRCLKFLELHVQLKGHSADWPSTCVVRTHKGIYWGGML